MTTDNKIIVDGHRPCDARYESLLLADGSILWGNGDLEKFATYQDAETAFKAFRMANPSVTDSL